MVAIEALAERRSVDTDALGISLVPIGGAQAIGRFLDLFVPQGLKLAGLCDAGRGRRVRGASSSAPAPAGTLAREDMERARVYVCVEDLEDELIRAPARPRWSGLGGQGDLGSFRRSRSSRRWAGRTPSRSSSGGFMGCAAGDGRSGTRGCWSMRWTFEKDFPRPLDRLLAHVI